VLVPVPHRNARSREAIAPLNEISWLCFGLACTVCVVHLAQGEMPLTALKFIPESKTFWSPRDPRTKGWFLVGNTGALVALLASYVYFVKVVGPRFMKNRAPFENLKPLIRAYNLGMILVNAYLLQYLLSRTYLRDYSWYCQGIDYSNRDPATMEVLSMLYYYTFVRIIDFLDTIFFVFRKKYEHVSVLHVVHHCLVVLIGWYGAAHGYDGQPMLGTSINMGVHVIMYTYYFLASFGSRFQKYLGWKKYLTQLQLAQFLIAGVHMMIPVFQPGCDIPLDHIAIVMGPILFFIVMFSRFYVKTYLKKIQLLEKARKCQ